MRHHLAGGRRYVAPANDLPIGGGDELRVAFLDIALDEGPRAFHWRRIEKREKPTFPSHHVDSGMEALNVLLANPTDLDRHGLAP